MKILDLKNISWFGMSLNRGCNLAICFHYDLFEVLT